MPVIVQGKKYLYLNMITLNLRERIQVAVILNGALDQGQALMQGLH